MEFSPLPRATSLAHSVIKSHLGPGKIAIDATAGNGHDTLFLANQVGPTGRVFGFDIQAAAIETTQRKIAEAGKENVTLFQASHEDIEQEISEPVDAAMFNLGYLPGGEKSVITQAEATIHALEACCRLGVSIITVVVYPGHEGGSDEATAVIEWAKNLDQDTFSVIQYGFINQRNHPPFLIAIERKA